jgi:hypothetical protein
MELRAQATRKTPTVETMAFHSDGERNRLAAIAIGATEPHGKFHYALCSIETTHVGVTLKEDTELGLTHDPCPPP